MSLVSLFEFQKLTLLSDEAVLWLLKHNRLSCSLDSDGSILIDTSAVTTKSLVQAISAIRSDTLATLDSALLEKCARRFSEHLEEIALEAARVVTREQAVGQHASPGGGDLDESTDG